VVSATPSAVSLAWEPSRDRFGVTGYGVYLDRRVVATSSQPGVTISGLDCGRAYTFGVDAYDAAGNRSRRAWVTVATAACRDQQAPAAPSGFRQQAATQNEVVLAWDPSTDNIGVVGYGVYRNGLLQTSTAAPTVTLSGFVCGSAYEVAVDAVDAAGNRSQARSTWVTTAACSDTQRPATPSNQRITEVTQTSITMAWSASTDDVGVIGYYVSLNGVRVGSTAQLSYTYTGLNCGTTYTVGLEAFDAAGNTTDRAYASGPATTAACSSPPSPPPPPADTTAPSQPGGLAVAAATNTSVTLAWTASTDNVGVAGYGVYVNGADVQTKTQPGATVSGLACGTAYTLAVDAYDLAGNRSTKASVVGTTAPCADTQAPSTPANVAVTSRTATSIALSWSASSDNVGVVGYGLYRGATLMGTTAVNTGIFSNLACGSSFTLAVDSYDAAGNRSGRATVTASTTACPDTTPPAMPTGLSASNVTGTSLTLSWNASTDDVGVTGYDIYRNGAKTASVTGTSSSQTGLACGTSYAFAVVSFDAAGNRSSQAQLTAPTSACAPPPPPPPPPPPSPPGARLFVSPSGSDAGSCSSAAPCRSFQRAYQLAAPGTVVEVAGGTYPGQGLSAVAGKTAPNVVFEEAPGAQVILGGISVAGADYVTFRGFETGYVDATHQRGVHAGPGSTYVTFEDIDAGSVSSWFADHLTVLGGDYGPCYSPPKDCSNNKQDASRNVLIDGATFHDLLAAPGDHWECMYVNGSDGFTIRNSRFRGCAIFDLFLTISGSDAGAMGHRNVLIENNWFESAWTESGPVRGWSALSLSWCQNAAQPSYRNVTIRNNSFQNGAGIEKDLNASGAGCQFQNVRVTGNLASYGGCQSGFSYDWNLWSGSSTCSATDRNLASFPYVNNAHGAAQNYHLSGPLGLFDNFVPLGCPATDVDGEARPQGAACEAGSDER
jgi:chitodextrinase